MSDQFPKEYHASSLIESGRKLAVITGSGIDAEAGLPTFRGEKGYYEDQEASYLASMEALQNEPIRQYYPLEESIQACRNCKILLVI